MLSQTWSNSCKLACVAIAVNKDMFIAWHPGRCDSLQDDPAWCFLAFFCSAPFFSYLAPLPARVLWQTCRAHMFVSIELFETKRAAQCGCHMGGRVSGLWRGNPSTYFMTSSPVAAFLHRTERGAHYNTKTQEQRRGCRRSSLSHLRQPRSGNRAVSRYRYGWAREGLCFFVGS